MQWKTTDTVQLDASYFERSQHKDSNMSHVKLVITVHHFAFCITGTNRGPTLLFMQIQFVP